jgi:hypothetical protein
VGELTFYFDRCFGKRFPEALERAIPPFRVEYHHNRKNAFREDMPDDEWLAHVGAKQWIVFSHDRRFHKETASLMAIKQHGIGCFYLPGGDAKTWDKLLYFVKSCASCIRLTAATQRPFVYRINKKSQLTRLTLP